MSAFHPLRTFEGTILPTARVAGPQTGRLEVRAGLSWVFDTLVVAVGPALSR